MNYEKTDIVMYIKIGFLKSLYRSSMCCVGIIALLCVVLNYVKRENYVQSTIVIKSSQYCYGVYVFHQFFSTIYISQSYFS